MSRREMNLDGLADLPQRLSADLQCRLHSLLFHGPERMQRAIHHRARLPLTRLLPSASGLDNAGGERQYIVPAYNSSMISPQDAPRSWEDLL